jgi:hypothetical protein
MNNVMLRGMVTSPLGLLARVKGQKGRLLRSERGGAEGSDVPSRLVMRLTDHKLTKPLILDWFESSRDGRLPIEEQD